MMEQSHGYFFQWRSYIYKRFHNICVILNDVREKWITREHSTNFGLESFSNDIIEPHFFEGNLNSKLYQYLFVEQKSSTSWAPYPKNYVLFILECSVPFNYRRWEGRDVWQPWSLDINLLDIFIWRHLSI